MLRLAKRITGWASSKKGAKLVLVLWILAAVLLGGLAPSASEYATSVNATGLPADAQSLIADKKLEEYFPKDQGVPALLVFHKESPFTDADWQRVDAVSERIEGAQLDAVKEAMPLHKLPPAAKTSMLSESKTTLILPVSLKDNLERKVINQTVKDLNVLAENELKDAGGLQLSITGPAGIVADLSNIFASADVVLLLATIGLIFVLLILIYRSPLLAFVPLIGAALVYEVVNKTIGIAGSLGMGIESQSVSIMSILLFAALTDYSLFIVSRFKEELKKEEDKYTAIKRCMQEVTEPILYSGGTVLAAMLVLFTALYEPYRNFAPVFSIAMALILLGGLTLLPALYALVGRRAFWPSVPKAEPTAAGKPGFWGMLGEAVVKRPVRSGLLVLIPLAALALNTLNIEYSFNLIKSFPEDIQSRQGYEALEKAFSPGELAPTTVLVENDAEIKTDQAQRLREKLLGMDGVDQVLPDPAAPQRPGQQESWLSEDKKTAKLELRFAGSPYDQETIGQLEAIRKQAGPWLEELGLSDAKLHFAGETAKQVDTRDVNNRDTLVVVAAITALITLLLALQTRSAVAPLYMMATIILSYFTAMGAGYLFFDKLFGYTEISYRIPLYTFIFLVALGVDYNIMLISRIKEEARTYPIREAISRGLTMTGGVISSAGLILAATFAVLTTQPIMELFIFGFTVAVGVLIDTFLIRTILVPAIMVKLGRYSLWPQLPKESAAGTPVRGSRSL
ncbi:membrane protein [Paenibacillus sp. J31TS4]|uniref:MMPL family transporter n=1 Tax=Paenibacillus sp. J31TS4 TaxID=2807195 RepID=UPI001B1F8649|nr:MMPL family transporter [Paenibacillus sp. J31TS4]GIP41420.1 membrane protein [Paenibacillus sp. J31TS4]